MSAIRWRRGGGDEYEARVSDISASQALTMQFDHDVYAALRRVAEAERSDVPAIVRRAVVEFLDRGDLYPDVV